MVQRRAKDESRWILAAGPAPPGVGLLSDHKPPTSGKVLYRVYHKTPMGSPGPPSPFVEVVISGD